MIRTKEKPLYKWRISKANWNEFTKEIEDNIPDYYQYNRAEIFLKRNGEE